MARLCSSNLLFSSSSKVIDKFNKIGNTSQIAVASITYDLFSLWEIHTRLLLFRNRFITYSLDSGVRRCSIRAITFISRSRFWFHFQTRHNKDHMQLSFRQKRTFFGLWLCTCFRYSLPGNIQNRNIKPVPEHSCAWFNKNIYSRSLDGQRNRRNCHR